MPTYIILVILLLILAIFSLYLLFLLHVKNVKITYLLDRRDEMAVAIRYINFINCGGIISDNIKKMGYERIAVYGDSRLFNLFYQELLKQNVNIVCRIVKTDHVDYDNTVLCVPFEKMPECDVIIYVTDDKEIDRLLDNSENVSIPRMRITRFFSIEE